MKLAFRPVTTVTNTDCIGFPMGGIAAHCRELLLHTPRPHLYGAVGITIDETIPLGSQLPFRLRRDVEFLALFRTSPANYARRRVPFKARLLPLLTRIAPVLVDSAQTIYLHDLEFAVPILLAKHARRSGARVIIASHDHGSYLSDSSRFGLIRATRPLYAALEAWTVGLVDALIAVSAAGYDYYRARYGRYSKKILYVPNGADTVHFRRLDQRAMRTRLGLPDDIPVIASVGRLAAVKDIPLALRVAKRLSKERRIRLVIAGDGEERGAVERLIQDENLQQMTVLMGNLDQQQLVALYSAADLLLVTSFRESLPMAVLEALSCELPVVTTSVGELPRLIIDGETGFCSNSRDVTELSGLCARVLDGQFSRTSCRATAVRHSAGAMAAAIDNILGSV